MWVRGHSMSLKMAPFDRSCTTRMTELPYGEKSMTVCWAVFIWYRNVTDRRTVRIMPCDTNYNDWGIVWWRNYDSMLSSFDRIPERDRQKELLYQYRASQSHWRAIKMIKLSVISMSPSGCYFLKSHPSLSCHLSSDVSGSLWTSSFKCQPPPNFCLSNAMHG